MKLTKPAVGKTIDHTFLSPDGTLEDVKELREKAREHNFATLAISPDSVKYASEKLEDTEVGVDVAIGFPLGYTTTGTKVF